MSFSFGELIKYGLRVLTRNGPGRLMSFEDQSGIVKLDKAWAGSRDLHFCSKDQSEMVLESDFTLVRVINLSTFAPIFITSAQNYPSWEECLNAMNDMYSSNETLLALNFKQRVFKANRNIISEDPYQILEVGLSVYRQHTVNKFYSSLEEAKKDWKDDIDAMSGTSGELLLCVLLDFDKMEIMARAIFATTQVVSKETFW